MQDRGSGESHSAFRPGRVALARQVVQALVQVAPTQRPEVIGGVLAFDASDATVTEAVYFTSEAAAREGERKPMPAEAAALVAEWQALLSDMRYLDLPEPWLYSPAVAQ